MESMAALRRRVVLNLIAIGSNKDYQQIMSYVLTWSRADCELIVGALKRGNHDQRAS